MLRGITLRRQGSMSRKRPVEDGESCKQDSMLGGKYETD